MKKLLQILSTSIVGASMMVGVAGAATISNTGPNSTNRIENNNSNSSTTNCRNNVQVSNNTNQTSSSGSASTSGNTNGGSASSGSASNSNRTSAKVDASCGTAGSTAAAGGKGAAAKGGQGAAATGGAGASSTAGAANVAALPATGTNSVLDAAIIGVATIGGAVAVSQLGVQAFRRSSLK